MTWPATRGISTDDVALARQAGADLIFAPEVETIYPPGFDTTVEVGRLVRSLGRRFSARAFPSRGDGRDDPLESGATRSRLFRREGLPAASGDPADCTAIWRCQARSSAARRCVTTTGSRCRPATCSFRRRNALVPWRCRAPSRAVYAAAARAKLTLAGSKRPVSPSSIAPGSRSTILRLSMSSSLEPLQSLRRGARLLIAAHVGGTQADRQCGDRTTGIRCGSSTTMDEH